MTTPDEMRDALAMLMQRAAEAETAWRVHAAAQARWREAAQKLRDALVEVVARLAVDAG